MVHIDDRILEILRLMDGIRNPSYSRSKEYKPEQHYQIGKTDLTNLLPQPDTIQLPKAVLGHGTLGRHYLGSSTINVNEEYAGPEYHEIRVHETIHYSGNHDEHSTRNTVRMMLGETYHH